ncbi:MAG: hypothetical protein V1708_00125 [Candidatus Micrarchaeota archaeon]
MKPSAVLVALLLSSFAATSFAAITDATGQAAYAATDSHSTLVFAPATVPASDNSSQPCSIDGAKRDCPAASDCLGRQACQSGSWSACAKADMCCAVNCDDGSKSTADSCDRGVCRYVEFGKAIQKKYLASPTGQKKSAQEWTAQDIEAALAELPPGPEVDQLRALVGEAKRFSMEGKAGESDAAWQQIGVRLDSLLSKARYFELQSLGFAVSMILVIIILAAYIAVYYRKRRAYAKPTGQEKALARYKQVESEKAGLARRFMKREIDYESYTKLIEALNSESMRQRSRLPERK